MRSSQRKELLPFRFIAAVVRRRSFPRPAAGITIGVRRVAWRWQQAFLPFRLNRVRGHEHRAQAVPAVPDADLRHRGAGLGDAQRRVAPGHRRTREVAAQHADFQSRRLAVERRHGPLGPRARHQTAGDRPQPRQPRDHGSQRHGRPGPLWRHLFRDVGRQHVGQRQPQRPWQCLPLAPRRLLVGRLLCRRRRHRSRPVAGRRARIHGSARTAADHELAAPRLCRAGRPVGRQHRNHAAQERHDGDVSVVAAAPGTAAAV